MPAWGSLLLVGCRARIRTWAKGSKVLCATATQPGSSVFESLQLEDSRSLGIGTTQQPWCRRSDSNRHGGCPPTVFETAASTIPPLRLQAILLPALAETSSSTVSSLFRAIQSFLFLCGAEERSRTADTRIFSPLLYRLSYLGVSDIVGVPHTSVKQG